ncbi:endonuclease 8-like 1 isoform X2 [Paramacrobiotus metropolitanus]|nr:endonuclease 8-like 1 isoform X2 [Paramacrobiotus metropolitanus]
MEKIEWAKEHFTVRALSRGKELQMILEEVSDKAGSAQNSESLNGSSSETSNSSLMLTFGFGMSGKFSFDRFDAIPKHAHLQFFTDENPSYVLSFVDYRRFGTWRVGDFDFARGPDPVKDYKDFRQNVLGNLDKSVFNKAICEAIMEQKYFNGIGNYLRAEILHRAEVPPFVAARSVLEKLAPKDTVDVNNPDLLDYCNLVPKEVFNIMKPGEGYNPKSDKEIYRPFKGWLRCYMVEGMTNLVDRQGRTIWFAGNPGPMVPAKNQSRHGARGKRRRSPSSSDDDNSEAGSVKERKGVSEDNSEAEALQSQPSVSQKIKREVPQVTPVRNGKRGAGGHATSANGNGSSYFVKVESDGAADTFDIKATVKVAARSKKGKTARQKVEDPEISERKHSLQIRKQTKEAAESEGADPISGGKTGKRASKKAKGTEKREKVKNEPLIGSEKGNVRHSARLVAVKDEP